MGSGSLVYFLVGGAPKTKKGNPPTGCLVSSIQNERKSTPLSRTTTKSGLGLNECERT